MLGSSEDNTALSRALSQLAEVEERIEQLYQEQVNSDFFILAELLSDYIRLLSVVRVSTCMSLPGRQMCQRRMVGPKSALHGHSWTCDKTPSSMSRCYTGPKSLRSSDSTEKVFPKAVTVHPTDMLQQGISRTCSMFPAFHYCRVPLTSAWKPGRGGRMPRPCCKRSGRRRPGCCGPTNQTSCSKPKRRSQRWGAFWWRRKS